VGSVENDRCAGGQGGDIPGAEVEGGGTLDLPGAAGQGAAGEVRQVGRVADVDEPALGADDAPDDAHGLVGEGDGEHAELADAGVADQTLVEHSGGTEDE